MKKMVIRPLSNAEIRKIAFTGGLAIEPGMKYWRSMVTSALDGGVHVWRGSVSSMGAFRSYPGAPLGGWPGPVVDAATSF